MKNIIIAFVLFLNVFGFAQDVDSNTFLSDYKLQGDLSLNLDFPDADVAIQSGEGGQIDLVIRLNPSMFENELSQSEVDEIIANSLNIKVVNKNGNSVFSITPKQKSKDVLGSVALTVPANSNLTLNVEDGDVAITNLTNDVKAIVGDGDLSLANLASENLSVKLEDGDIMIANIVSTDVYAKTEDGDIMVANSMSDKFTLKSGDGDIALANSKGYVSAKTGDGDIVTQGHDGEVNAVSGDGEVVKN